MSQAESGAASTSAALDLEAARYLCAHPLSPPSHSPLPPPLPRPLSTAVMCMVSISQKCTVSAASLYMTAFAFPELRVGSLMLMKLAGLQP